MNRGQLLEVVFLLELINKKNLEDIIKDYKSNSKNYSNMEIELINNKLNLIKSKKTKYIKNENVENIKVYSYEERIELYHDTIINKNKIIEIIEKENKNEIFLIENKKEKKIKKEDIYKINKDFKILIK